MSIFFNSPPKYFEGDQSMPNQDHWFRMELGELVQDTASSLAANYNRYYPKAHSCDPNERDLTIAFGSALTKRRYAVFNEVPVRSGISGNREDRIDLLAIASTNNHASLVESKNIFSSKQRATVVSDFSKMHGSSPLRSPVSSRRTDACQS